MAIILYNSIKCISFPMTVKFTEIFKEGWDRPSKGFEFYNILKL